MLHDTKRDLINSARQLARPYESYTIDELANAYCAAVDTNNAVLKNIGAFTIFTLSKTKILTNIATPIMVVITLFSTQIPPFCLYFK